MLTRRLVLLLLATVATVLVGIALGTVEAKDSTGIHAATRDYQIDLAFQDVLLTTGEVVPATAGERAANRDLATSGDAAAPGALPAAGGFGGLDPQLDTGGSNPAGTTASASTPDLSSPGGGADSGSGSGGSGGGPGSGRTLGGPTVILIPPSPVHVRGTVAVSD